MSFILTKKWEILEHFQNLQMVQFVWVTVIPKLFKSSQSSNKNGITKKIQKTP